MISLNPVHTIGRQTVEMLRLHTGLDRAARRQRCAQMLESVGISQAEERLDSYPHQFSGGMRQTVVIAISMLAQPRLIIADEPTTALDVTVQVQILRLMKREIRQQGASLILVTHDLAVVAEMVDKITVLYCGRVVETGPVRRVLDAPAHPYTRGLIDSIPNPDHRLPRLREIPGTVPDIRNLPKGCAFRARCPRADVICAEVEPELTAQPGGNSAACHFPLGAGELA